MLPALGAEMGQNRRRGGHDAGARLALAVQHPQRVCLQAPVAVGAQLAPAAFQKSYQRRAVPGAALDAADGIHLQHRPRHPQLLPQIPQHQQQLRVDEGIRAAEHFGADLVELAQPALLGALPPEHGPEIVELPHRLHLVELSLDVGPHHPRRTFRPQAQQGGLRVPVGEGVHLLLDDVGALPQRTRKELGLLQDGNSNLLEVVSGKYLYRGLFDPLPEIHFIRRNVRESLDAGQFHKHPRTEVRDGIMVVIRGIGDR